MKRILCPGEALIDFVAVEQNQLIDSETFIKKAGGAPANAAGAMAKLGVESAFIGTVGNDPFGHFLKREMDKHQIDTSNVQMDDDNFTTFAYVSIDQDGERDFIFNRGADAKLTIDHSIIEKYDGVHFASATAFLGDTLEASYFELLNLAKEQNKLISFDANYRDALFSGKEKIFIKKCKDFISQANIVKLSEEEAHLISGKEDLDEAINIITALGCDYLIVTLGAAGARLVTRESDEIIPSIKVDNVVDTTGAGDAFIGAVVASAIKEEALDFKKMKAIIKLANKVGAITITNYGALESIPSLEDVIDL